MNTSLLLVPLFWSSLLFAADAQENEIDRLKTVLAEQQKQLQTMQQTLDKQQALLEKALGSSSAFNGIGQVASTTPVIPVTPLPAVAVPQRSAVPAPAAEQSSSSPLQLKIGDAWITPVGFM